MSKYITVFWHYVQTVIVHIHDKS